MKRKITAFAAMALTMALSASAAVIVDFVAGTSTENQPVADVQTLFGDTWTFRDAGDALGALADISSTTKNGKFYGGVIATWATSADYNPLFRNLTATRNDFQLRMANGTDDYAFKGVYLWNQADYASGAGSSAVLGVGSTINWYFGGFASAGASKGIRAVVNQGGTYYVSETSSTVSNTTGYDIGSANWAALNTTDYTWGNFGSLTLDDVRGVGIYFEGGVTNSTAAGAQLTTLSVTAVPEPSTFALLAGLVTLGLIVRRQSKL